MSTTTPRPIAFMVMPFRKRQILLPPDGAPIEVDFDALWDKAFRPALEELGYLAVRADSETGSVIVKDMLERLAFADLVVADMTLPNGNVYYEVGIRHVAQETSCVLIAADWSKQLFDVDQMRTMRYPLIDGAVPDATAEAIKAQLVSHLPNSRDSKTPFHELVTNKETAAVFRDQIETISGFQTAVRAVRLLVDDDLRRTKVLDLVTTYSGKTLEIDDVALELLTLVRDTLSWDELLAFERSLPDRLQKNSLVREQILLAQSKLGDHVQAIAGLEELIRLRGDSGERRGLIGGRYKAMWREAKKKRLAAGLAESEIREQALLDKAIEQYRLGMELDLNEYYCLCNLPGLLRDRNADGDADEAVFFDRLTVMAVRTKLTKGTSDEWARKTLLGAAFRSCDLAQVKQLVREVAAEGAAVWKLDTTLQDINDTLAAMPMGQNRTELEKCRDQLTGLIMK